MKSQNYIPTIFLIGLLLLVSGCTEEFVIETKDFESALVVEATITNELKHQEVKLSRTSLLEANGQVMENNANISVVDDTNTTFTFSQNDEGVYISDNEFQAEANKEYNLHIITANGKEYVSKNTELTPISQINNLYPEYINDDNNGFGVQIYLDNQNNDIQPRYFRYEYEETYKLIVPFDYPYGIAFSNYEAFTDSNCGIVVFYDWDIFLKNQEEQTCYSTNRNSEIIQTNTTNFSENNISRLPIRFLPADKGFGFIDISILRERYSIKVRQYVQNIEAYTYYKVISQLGNNESILSQNQPGFVQGNLVPINNNDRIIGFFEVSSVAEKRIFFNYSDVNIPYPEYLYECDQQSLDYNDNVDFPCGEFDANERNLLYLLVTRENYRLFRHDTETKKFSIAKQECVNCTSAGTNVQPDFWQD